MTIDKLLIIGAGPVGLAMASALKANDIPYDQVDAKGGLGGNWHSGVYVGVHLNSSRKSTEFGDYPMPDHYPDFPSAAEMKAYLNDYARAKGIDQGIEFKKSVVETLPQSDDSWLVRFAEGDERNYKGVVVCNGHHWDSRMPELPGEFAGELIHSKDYTGKAQLEGKRVLVIGAGNSACDIACDSARFAKSADVSMRTGYWFLPRVVFGRPINDVPIWHLPVTVQRWILRGIIWVTLGDFRKYGLEKPSHRIFDRHTTFGAEMLHYMTLGRIKPRRAINGVNGNTVSFSDGASADYDMIVAATGFNFRFPFLPDGLVDVKGDVVQLYGFAFPPNVKNLYIIGATQPRGGFGYLLTPASDLYAKVIKMQDELEHPVGSILEYMGEKIPKTHLVDPGGARREIIISKAVLGVVKWMGRRLQKKRPWTGMGAYAVNSSKPAVSPTTANPISEAAE
ncbi:MAG: NAD(P)-binding domain-containing protein [Pseudomonadota bacterium]